MATTKSNIYIDGSQAGATLNELRKEYNKVNSAIKEMKRDSDDYRESVKKLGDLKAAINKHQSDVKSISQSYEQAGKTMKEMSVIQKQNASGWKSIASNALPFAGVAGAIAAGAQLVSSAVSSWYNNNKELEKSLSSLRSLTGASEEDMKFYEAQAKELGRTTTITAVQAVNAFKLIGSARPDLLKDKEALAEVTKQTVVLAEAAEMELEPAAQALAGAMNQFGLGAEEAGRIINTLAAGSQAGAAEIVDLTASIEKFGTVAQANNVTIEESVALTELLSEKNLKGAEAGTGLRNVLLSLSTASALDAKAVEALQQYGVNMELVMNKAVPLSERLREMSKISGDQTALLKVFGKENVVVGQTILTNVARYEQLNKAVTDTNTAYIQAAINTDNLDGDLKKLSSAWEGLTLSTSAAQSPMRGVIQIGTEFLTWITDVVQLLTEWNDLKAEEILLKFGKYLTYLNPLMLVFGDSVRDSLDELLRMNRLTQEVVEGFKAEADAAATLTMIIDQNNKALKSKNITESEAEKLTKENADAVQILSEKYPELTKNIDWNKASSKELSKLQKDITKNLLNQSLAAVQATEAERLLAEQVQLSMQIAEQRAKEQNRWGITNFVADVFADDAADLEEQLQKSQASLNRLPETMKDVADRVKGLNLNFGEKFSTQLSLIEKSTNKINRLKFMVQQWENSPMAKYMKRQIESEEKVLKVLKEQSEQEKKNALDKQQKEKQQTDAENAKTKAAEKAEKAAEKARQKMEDLRKTLDDILKRSKDFERDFNYEKRLADFTDEFAKEMFIAEEGIKKKYASEIESAKKLSKEKGKIGEEARSTLTALEALQTEEIEFIKQKIRDKYRLKGEEELDLYLESQKQKEADFEKSKMEIKLARAYAYVREVEKMDAKTRQKALHELQNALIVQAQFEHETKIKALQKQLEEQSILEDNYNAQREEAERVLNEKIKEINVSTQDQILQIFERKFTEIIEALQSVVNTAQKFMDAYFNNQLNQIQEEKNTAIQAEEARFNAGLSTREEFEMRKQAIEAESEKKRIEIERKQAERAKQVAMFEAAINTLVASTKVLNNPLLLALTIAAGVAQQALIASEPMPQFAEGGFKSIIGASDNKTYNAKKVAPLKGGMTPNQPSYALFSEKGPEYFVPNRLLSDQRVASMVGAIEAIRLNQYANGGFTMPVINTMNDQVLIQLLQQNLTMLAALNRQIPNMGVKIGDKQIDDISTRSNEINSFKA